MVSATYPANTKPILRLTSRVSLRNYAIDLSAPGKAPHASKAELAYFLQPSRCVPTDGIVKETAVKATAGTTTDVEKAHAVYNWVVDNTFRDPKVRGCGRGDIWAMLESGDMGGKCADLNAFYVGLARSVGLPARHVYGFVLPSRTWDIRALDWRPTQPPKDSIAEWRYTFASTMGSGRPGRCT